MDDLFRGHYDPWNEKRLAYLMSRWGQSWFAGKRVLELGCGHAYLGRALQKLGAHVTCVDARQEHLDVVRSLAPDIRCFQADLNCEWPVSGKFDLVLHLGILYHLENIHFSLERSFANSDVVMLETEVLDTLAEQCLSVEEDRLLYDQSYTGKGTRPSASYLESLFHEQGFYAFRLADDRCNARHDDFGHYYDWPCRDTGGWQHGKRRMWILQRKSSIPTPTARNMSVVVQGPVVGAPDVKPRWQLTRRCLGAIRQQLPEAELILSTWEGSDTRGLEFDRLVESPDPGGTCCDDVYQVQNNVNRQIVSSIAGIRVAQHPYCLKIRSDLILHSNRFLRYWQKFPQRQSPYRFTAERMLNCSVFARRFAGIPGKTTRLPFHPSDFLVFGFREDLSNLFDIPLAQEPESSRWFDLHPRDPGVYDCFDHNNSRFFPEQYIWLSFVRKFMHLPMEHRLDLNQDVLLHDTPSLINNLVFLDQSQWRFALPKYHIRQYTLPQFQWEGLYRHSVWRQFFVELCGGRPLAGATYDSTMRYLFHDNHAARRLQRKTPNLFGYVQKKLRKQQVLP